MRCAERHDAPMQFTGIGSMLAVHFTRDPVRSPADAAKGDPKLKELFFFDMLSQGIWMARRGMFTLCLPIGDAECDKLAARGRGVPRLAAFVADDRLDFALGSPRASPTGARSQKDGRAIVPVAIGRALS